MKHKIAPLIVLLLATTGALAQQYPSRPITIINPFSPGGSADLLTRQVAGALTKRLGQSVVVDYKPGAGGTVGSGLVARSAPDGYTLLLSNFSSQIVSPAVYRSLSFDAQKDFTHVALLGALPNVLAVRQASPYRTVADLVADAKKEGSNVAFGSAGNGSSGHLSAVLFQKLSGTRLVHVPYKGGGPASLAVLSGEVSFLFDNLPNVAPRIDQGQMRGLCVTSTTRSPLLKEVPTCQESGYPELVVRTWAGISAPSKLPPEALRTLSAGVTDVMAEPGMRTWLVDHGFDYIPLSPSEFSEFIAKETKTWMPLIAQTGLKPD